MNEIPHTNPNKNTRGNFDIEKKRSEIIEKLNIPGYKDGIDFLFEQNPELIDSMRNLLASEKTTRLYRIENKNIPYDKSREWIVSRKEIIWCFFTENTETLSNYIRKNQSKPGIKLVYIDIPTNQLEKFHVSNNEYTQNMDVENDNRILPNTIKRNYVDISSLHKVTGNFLPLKEAKEHLNKIIEGLSQTKCIDNEKIKNMYAEYLTTIFPESKVKDILYHGTINGKFDTFNTEGSIDNIWKLGAMAGSLKAANVLRGKEEKPDWVRPEEWDNPPLPEGSFLFQLKFDIKNPYISKSLDEAIKLNKNVLKEKWYDGIIIHWYEIQNNRIKETGYENEYVVFEPKQIHILWSDKDIEQLKEWLKNKK